MSVNKVLLTGDDGYNSVGIRTLAHFLKKDFDLKIAATLKQQSGTGGKMNLKDDIVWDEEIIDGVQALWVDGSPVDAVEVAQAYFDEKFDLVVSGINYGENLTYSLVSSGTFSAAVRAIGVQIAPQAIVMSWQTDSSNFLREHDLGDSLELFIKYPGKIAYQLIHDCIQNDFYDKELVNINFPNKPTTKIKTARIGKNITRHWKYPLIIDKDRKLASFPKETYSENLYKDTGTDVGALHKGYITVTPLSYLE